MPFSIFPTHHSVVISLDLYAPSRLNTNSPTQATLLPWSSSQRLPLTKPVMQLYALLIILPHSGHGATPTFYYGQAQNVSFYHSRPHFLASSSSARTLPYTKPQQKSKTALRSLHWLSRIVVQGKFHPAECHLSLLADSLLYSLETRLGFVHCCQCS